MSSMSTAARRAELAVEMAAGGSPGRTGSLQHLAYCLGRCSAEKLNEIYREEPKLARKFRAISATTPSPLAAILEAAYRLGLVGRLLREYFPEGWQHQ